MEKGGDSEAAARYRKEAAARRAPVAEVPIQTRANLAYSKLRATEKKLQVAVTKLEEQQAASSKQREVVVDLRAELVASENSHKQLVSLLSQSVQAQPPAPAVLSVKDILEGNLERTFVVEANFFEASEAEYELSDSDKAEIEARCKALNEGLKKMCADLFAQAKATADRIKSDHEAHVRRLSSKRARTGEDPGGPQGVEAVPEAAEEGANTGGGAAPSTGTAAATTEAGGAQSAQPPDAAAAVSEPSLVSLKERTDRILSDVRPPAPVDEGI